MKQTSRMYDETKSWNPFVGCKFDCDYCKPSFQRQVKRVGHFQKCQDCIDYLPHEHPERLDIKRIPTKYPIIAVCLNGDLSFARPEFVRRIIGVIKEFLMRHPEKLIYLQSKDPQCFEQYIPDLKEIEDNVFLVTTLETNRDNGYKEYSDAPCPTKRYADFLSLDYPNKIVTIEPLMEFDLLLFLGWIVKIKPKRVYLGLNSRPEHVTLPEPSLDKLWDFKRALDTFTEVILKNEDRLES